MRYTGNQRKVIDGPFAETKELIAGYTLIQVRQLYELEDFGDIEAAQRFKDMGAGT